MFMYQLYISFRALTGEVHKAHICSSVRLHRYRICVKIRECWVTFAWSESSEHCQKHWEYLIVSSIRDPWNELWWLSTISTPDNRYKSKEMERKLVGDSPLGRCQLKSFYWNLSLKWQIYCLFFTYFLWKYFFLK